MTEDIEDVRIVDPAEARAYAASRIIPEPDLEPVVPPATKARDDIVANMLEQALIAYAALEVSIQWKDVLRPTKADRALLTTLKQYVTEVESMQ